MKPPAVDTLTIKAVATMRFKIFAQIMLLNPVELAIYTLNFLSLLLIREWNTLINC